MRCLGRFVGSASICPPPPPTSLDDLLVASPASIWPPPPPRSPLSSRLIGRFPWPPSALPPPPTSHDDSLGSFPASICPSTTTNNARLPTNMCQPPPTSRLTPHTTTTNRSPHLTPLPPRATSPAPLSATGPVKRKKKRKGNPASLFLFQVCFFPPPITRV